MASFKGGVGKSTSAVHIAAYLARSAKTLLVDGDPNRSVTRWAAEGRLPFTVVSEAQATMHARNYEHIVIDTKARPDPDDLREIATGCHLLVLPCTPDPLSVDALLATVKELKGLGSERFRVLLTIVPPRPNERRSKSAGSSGRGRSAAFQGANSKSSHLPAMHSRGSNRLLTGVQRGRRGNRIFSKSTSRLIA